MSMRRISTVGSVIAFLFAAAWVILKIGSEQYEGGVSPIQTKVEDSTLFRERPVSMEQSNVVDYMVPQCPVAKPTAFPSDITVFLPDHSSSKNVQAQLQAASALSSSPLDEAKSTALRWLIHQPDCSDVVRNELLNTLRVWKPEWLTGDLARMSTDPAQNKVWRSYCIQHLGHIYGATKDEAALKAIQDATSSEEPAVRDQAIFSLGLLAKQLDWAKADPKAQEAFNADLKRLLASGAPSSQASALRAIAHAEVRDFVFDVEALAKDPKQPLQVRVAAVQALGQIGRPESVAVLEACAKEDGSKKRLVEQAELQLGRLKKVLATATAE